MNRRGFFGFLAGLVGGAAVGKSGSQVTPVPPSIDPGCMLPLGPAPGFQGGMPPNQLHMLLSQVHWDIIPVGKSGQVLVMGKEGPAWVDPPVA